MASSVDKDGAEEDRNTPPEADGDQGEVRGSLLKLALEIGPLVVFFIANARLGIFMATGLFMAATAVALVASRVLLGRIPVMPLVTGVFVLVFGALTLFFSNDTFIKIKPTIVNMLFAAVALGGLFFDWIVWKTLFGEIFALTTKGWRILQFRWGCFFLFLAILNEVVWRNFSSDTWVSFKLFGIMPLTMVFALAQMGVLKRHGLQGGAVDDTAQGGRTGTAGSPERGTG
ncbi:MAG: septation protein A [Hyphomicrobiaceae bacterium]